MKHVSVLAIFLTTLTPFSPVSTRSYAEPAKTPDLRKVRIKAGEKAPFTGVLLTVEALARTVAALEAETKRVRIELEAEREAGKRREEAAGEVAEARLEAERAKRAAVESDLERQRDVYERALSRASANPPWYRSRYLSFLAGAVVSGGVCAGVAAAR